MICKNCGKENLNDMIFCGYCGGRLASKASGGKGTEKKSAPKRKSSSMLTSFIVLFMAMAAVWFYNHKDNLSILKKDSGEISETNATEDMIPIEETVALANAVGNNDQSTAEGAFRMYYEGYNAENADVVFAISEGPYVPDKKEETKAALNTSGVKTVLRTVEIGRVYTGQEIEKIASYLEETNNYSFASYPLQEVACLQTTAVADTEEGTEYSSEVVMLKVGDKWYYDKNIEPEHLSEIL